MIYLNNRIVPNNKAVISVYDHGFLYGDGIYETLRAYDGIVFLLDQHIDRLFRSASMIALKIKKTPDAVKKAVYKTLSANRLKEAVIRITVSRGPGPTGLDPALCTDPTFVIIAREFVHYPNMYYKKGVRIALVDTKRNFKDALNPQIKSLNFLNNILAIIEAKKKDAYEAIMKNYRGYIAEGTISNIFFIKDRVLCTPGLDVGILDGITRRIILETARDAGMQVIEGRFKKDDLYNADEMFISNTTMEVMPVSEIDNKTISSRAGNLTKTLHKLYVKKIKDHIKTNDKSR
jgi:branched-chain amino acid aminotransferase